MMKVDDGLPGACPWISSPFTHLGRESVEPQKVAILGQDDVFLVGVPIQTTEFPEVSCVENTVAGLLLVGLFPFVAADVVEEGAGSSIEPINYRLWQ